MLDPVQNRSVGLFFDGSFVSGFAMNEAESEGNEDVNPEAWRQSKAKDVCEKRWSFSNETGEVWFVYSGFERCCFSRFFM